MRRFNHAQSTLEYAIIIAAVVAALLAIQIYMKRGVQGKLRESTDEIGEQFEASKTASTTEKTRSATSEQIVSGGTTTTTLKNEEQKTTQQTESVGSW